jgi:tetratricopeptide (TPR) repeat protein
MTPTGVRDSRYTFRHELFRDADYAALTDDDRVLGHSIAGEWLEQSGGGAAIVLAEHFERGKLPTRALKWYRRAAEHALEGNDFEETIRRCERGLHCAASGEDRGRLLVLKSHAYRWQGKHAETERYGTMAMDALPRGCTAWYTAAGLVATAAADADSAEMLITISNALCGMSPDDADVGPYLIAMSRAADRLLLLGRYEFAESLMARIRALEKHAAAAEPAVAAWIHRIRAYYARFLGDPATFASEMSKAAECFDDAGDLRNACLQRGNAGSGYLHGGAYDLAHHVLRDALDTAERLGLGNVVMSVRVDLGLVLARRGAVDRAVSVLEHVASSCEAKGMRRFECPARTYLAMALALSGDPQRAETEARVAVALTSANPPLRATALATWASVLLQLDLPNEGLREANKAVSQLQLTGGVAEGESLVRLVYAEALLAAGQRKAAKEAIEAARRRLLERAVNIRDDEFRGRFLRKDANNARTLELARELSDSSDVGEIS